MGPFSGSQSLQPIRILPYLLKLITDEKRKNTNMKQRGRGPIILRKYMSKYGRIGVSYMDDLGRRLEALNMNNEFNLKRILFDVQLMK